MYAQVSSRRQQMLDLLTSYLDEVGPSGESASEFLALYQRLTKAPHWKLYLAAKGVLPHIGTLLTKVWGQNRQLINNGRILHNSKYSGPGYA